MPHRAATAIFTRQGRHSGGHISGLPPPLSILQKALGALKAVAALPHPNALEETDFFHLNTLYL